MFVGATYKHTHLTIIYFHDSPTIANLKDLASRILHHQPMQTPETMGLSGDQKVGLESFNPWTRAKYRYGYNIYIYICISIYIYIYLLVVYQPGKKNNFVISWSQPLLTRTEIVGVCVCVCAPCECPRVGIPHHNVVGTREYMNIYIYTYLYIHLYVHYITCIYSLRKNARNFQRSFNENAKPSWELWRCQANEVHTRSKLKI